MVVDSKVAAFLPVVDGAHIAAELLRTDERLADEDGGGDGD